MHKRFDYLDKYRILKNKNTDEALIIKKIVKSLQEYYFIKDIEEGSQFLNLFNALYVSDKKMSYDEISINFYLNLATLYNYRKKFNSLAEKLKQVNQKNTVQSLSFLAIEF